MNEEETIDSSKNRTFGNKNGVGVDIKIKSGNIKSPEEVESCLREESSVDALKSKTRKIRLNCCGTKFRCVWMGNKALEMKMGRDFQDPTKLDQDGPNDFPGGNSKGTPPNIKDTPNSNWF